MNSIFEKYKWLKYVLASFVILVGALIIILGCLEPGSTIKIIDIILAVGLFVLGTFLFVTCILSESHKPFTVTLLIATLLFAGGILILVARFAFNGFVAPELLVYILAITTLVFGVAALLKGISLVVYKEKRTWIFVLFVIATVAITLGILGLCYAGQLLSVTYVILGIILVAAGTLWIIFSMIEEKKKSTSK